MLGRLGECTITAKQPLYQLQYNFVLNIFMERVTK